MPDKLKAALVLAAFALLSVAITAGASGLALRRPSLSHLTLDTRSRLVADYSADSLAMRLEPLNPDLIRAASQDEANLTTEPTTQIRDEPAPGETPADAPTLATAAPGRSPTATAPPPRSFLSSPTPPATSTRSPVATSPTRGPSPIPSPTVFKPTPTFTPPPTFTPTPKPTQTPQPTAIPPTPTNTPRPANTPTPTPKHDELCKRLDPPPPQGVCDLLP